jgi:hypothetical protein
MEVAKYYYETVATANTTVKSFIVQGLGSFPSLGKLGNFRYILSEALTHREDLLFKPQHTKCILE